eukprot:TRINITY_DN1714_c0_g1_i10.p1 TRINITY_DN1714_c0_g1~~TRINITY_DN1714_c0_g1_i10.p1  ORF type:complete len:248 (-),score=81.98 TRINITY_DN1714_c0_g1_i10:1603-2346(-)
MKDIKIFNNGFGNAVNSQALMSRVGKDRKGYDCRTKFNKYAWSLDKNKSEEFFSIFDKDIIQPKVEKVWVHQKMQKKMFRSLTDEEINNIYHTNDEKLSEKTFFEVEDGMLGGMREMATCTWRRIQVLFGTSLRNKRKLDCLKLEYFENVNPISETGVLRLSFSYQTYLNGVPLGIFPTDKVEQSKKPSDSKTSKKRKESEEEEPCATANLLEWTDPSQPPLKTIDEILRTEKKISTRNLIRNPELS